MYIPSTNRHDDIPTLHDFMRHNSFATVVTKPSGGESELMVSHVPVVLNTTTAPLGRLEFHVARENPHWQAFEPGERETTVIFVGPHSYISPKWYEHPGRRVPTWNYIAAHAHGRARLMEKSRLQRHLEELVDANEQAVLAVDASHEKPWRIADLPAELVGKLRQAIVGIEMEITRIEGKWKLGQNGSALDRRGAADGLRRVGAPGAEELARLMEETIRDGSTR